MNVHKKLVFVPGRTFQPNNLQTGPVAYIGVENLSGSPLGRAPDLVKKNYWIRLESLQEQTI
jgi:hypothetical protein